MLDQLKDLKDTYESVRTQVERGKEPIEDLTKIKNFLTAIAAEPRLLHETVDKDYRRYFYSELISGLLKKLIREKSKNNDYLELIQAVFEGIMLVLLSEIKSGIFNHDFFDSIKMLFEYDTTLHNFNYQIPEEDLKKLRRVNQEWRKEFNVGDLVDAIIDDNNRCRGWSQARISQINEDVLHLEFFKDVKGADKFVDRWSVEIAQFETKTKEIFDWKSSLKVGSLCDVHDKSTWNKSTILDMKEQVVDQERKFEVALIGYRVYIENGSKTDEGGKYEGWSNRFDEWISVYSPRIMQYCSKTSGGLLEDAADLDEDIDNVIEPEKGMNQVYAVPRARRCTSTLYLHLINMFGSLKGYEEVLSVLSNADIGSESGSQKFDLTIMAELMQCLSTPSLIYHKDFIKSYGPKVVEVAKKRLREAPEKSLRDVKKEKIESIIRSIDIIQRRLIPKDQREEEIENLKLEVALMCLKSSFLERRIQGIKDLNLIIRNNRMASKPSLTNSYMINWIKNNDVLRIILDPKRTHLQIVQRTSEILKLLLSEDMLQQSTLEDFWNLARGEHKFEIYKIISEIGQQLKQQHIEFLFQQVKSIPADKVGNEEFKCLGELGKYGKTDELKDQVGQYFWQILCNSSQYKDEIVNNSIQRYSEIVKNWSIESKESLLLQLLNNLVQNQSSMPTLKFIRLVIKDEKENENFANYINSSSPSKFDDDNNIQQINDEQEAKLTLNKVLLRLIKEHNLIQKLLKNFEYYCQQVKQVIGFQDKNLPSGTESPRKKLFFVSPRYSHHEEIDERLQFIKYLAMVCKGYKISRMELSSIYDLLVSHSKISSDQEEFLVWCKTSCQQSSAKNQILELNEVGQFFTEKMQNKELDLKNLPLVGFEFLQHYFLSVNEKEENLVKQQDKETNQENKITSISCNNGVYSTVYGPMPQAFQINPTKVANEPNDEKSPQFKLLKIPQQLSQLEIVWNIALQCESPHVVPKAIEFLIQVYSQLDESLNEHKVEVQSQMIQKCMDILSSSNEEGTLKRVVEIIKNIIYESEKKGTGSIEPHSSLLRGELLDKITIKNKASPSRGTIILSVHNNSTVWQFKKLLSKYLCLAPKYLKLELEGNVEKVIKDIENGMTLGDIGLKSEQVITAYKISVVEHVPNAPLIGPDSKLTDKASQIFNEWFDMYSDEAGQMTKQTCCVFIEGSTGESININDERVQSMFKTYDINNDGRIERQEFLQFYQAASISKPDTVRDNLRAHNIRNDLKKLSEIEEETIFASQDMPRSRISSNQEYFNLLMSMLERRDSASEAAWSLIQMLSTNQEIYKNVLTLEYVNDPSSSIVDWSTFFDGSSVYRLLYTLQIIEAAIQLSEEQEQENVVVLSDNNQIIDKKKESLTSATPGQESNSTRDPKNKETQRPVRLRKRTSMLIIGENEDKKLRDKWTKMFIKNKGIDYILSVLMTKDIQEDKGFSENDVFSLKYIAFQLKVLKIFLTAAFAASSKSDLQDPLVLERLTSNTSDETKQGNDNNQKSALFQNLQDQLQGHIGEQLTSSINYKALQQKILQIVVMILGQQKIIFEVKLIVENALSLWASCLLYKNELIVDFYQFQGDDKSSIKTCDDFVLTGILKCPEEKIREQFKITLETLSTQVFNNLDNKSDQPLYYLLRLLSERFVLISEHNSKQYFSLFCSLIQNYQIVESSISSQNSSEAQKIFDPQQILEKIIDKIKEYNIVKIQKEMEQNDSTFSGPLTYEEKEDIYIGLTQLTGKIIDNFDISVSERIIEEKSLIDELFVKFLFASIFNSEIVNDLTHLKIKPKKGIRKQNENQQFGKRSKEAAYKLLNSLIRKSPNLINSFLEKSLVPLVQQLKRKPIWNFSPPGQGQMAKPQKYVGLYNHGAICYMNSMLQQFFMIPAFRYNMLSVDDKLDEELVDYKGQRIDDNVLHQLQKLISHLELSQRQDYSPFEFCFAFKDLDGMPTNTGEQKDAQEFLNLAFDRIENLLRSTSRKYLLQSVFGGKTCSQLLCSECGKVKNRIEDFYNLSVTVKDIKSLHESLQKLIEGEVINDYECDGCKKKVDISKRTLISQTPNVLIVHLQRIIFNFDTFQNTKINSYFEFPYLLDLKPYSFQEVMKNEKRAQKKKETEDGDESQKQQQDEDDVWPEEEDCFEYKLVGVNVHSGSANQGHYWSYINTKRGLDEPDEENPSWQLTEQDSWMEFNDSVVKDFNFEKLKDDCYGGDGKSANSDDNQGFGGGGNTYGKSAYMLVYERRKKRPLKLLVPYDEAEEIKKQGQVFTSDTDKIHYDAKKDENFRLADYRDSVAEIAPNQIYKKVFEDNTKFSFENSVYSSEFFEFIKSTLSAVANIHLQPNSSEQQDSVVKARQNATIIAKKVILDILAKCYYNQDIKQIVENLINVFKLDDNLCKYFLQECFKEDNCGYLFEILLECTDAVSRSNVALLVKYVLNRLKIMEQDYLYQKQPIIYQYRDARTNQIVQEERTQPLALSARFITKQFSLMNTYVAQNWSRFEQFFDIMYSFAVGYYNNDVKTSQGAQQEIQEGHQEVIGLEFFFRYGFVQRACDFMLGKKSPLLQPGEQRQEMGGTYQRPNFGPLIKLVTKMITHEELLQKYPLDEQEKKMLLQHDLLNVMLGSNQGSKQFGECLASMCKDNLKLSKKVSKVFIKIINNSMSDNIRNYLKALKPFLKMQDSLKSQRLEWIFGFSQVIARKDYREERYKYGLELIDRINDDAHTYVSPLLSGPVEDALLTQLLKCRGKMDIFAINCLKEMISLMANDDDIAQYVYKSAPASYQAARYSDWIRPYLEHQRAEIYKYSYYNNQKSKLDVLNKSLVLLDKYEQKCQEFRQKELTDIQKVKEGNKFNSLKKNWLTLTTEEVIQHFPPQLIIGKQVEEEKVHIVYDEDPNVKIILYELTNEYIYSNPTGIFNLSLPHVELRTQNYSTMSLAQYKEMQQKDQNPVHQEEQLQVPNNIQTSTTNSQEPQQLENEVQCLQDLGGQKLNPQENVSQQNLIKATSADQIIESQATSYVQSMLPIYWHDHLLTSPIMLKVCVVNKLAQKLTVDVYLQGDTSTNVKLPASYFRESLIKGDVKCVGHLIKINPDKEWGYIGVNVATKIKNVQNNQVPNISQSAFSRNNAYVYCMMCKTQNDYGQMFCDACGDALEDDAPQNSRAQ